MGVRHGVPAPAASAGAPAGAAASRRDAGTGPALLRPLRGARDLRGGQDGVGGGPRRPPPHPSPGLDQIHSGARAPAERRGALDSGAPARVAAARRRGPPFGRSPHPVPPPPRLPPPASRRQRENNNPRGQCEGSSEGAARAARAAGGHVEDEFGRLKPNISKGLSARGRGEFPPAQRDRQPLVKRRAACVFGFFSTSDLNLCRRLWNFHRPVFL